MTSTSAGIVDSSGHWGEIDGVAIDFPVVVNDMNQLTLTFTVPIAAARALIPGEGFEVIEMAPGSAMFVVAIVDYVDNPWGDYNEVNLGFMANPIGRPEAAGAFVYRMPVNQEFTSKAGNAVLGLPKTVEELTFEYRSPLDSDAQDKDAQASNSPDRTGTVLVNLAMDGEPTLKVTFPRAHTDDAPASTETVTFSYLDGQPTEVPLQIELGAAVIDPAEVVIELGTSKVADELRSLGLPSAPDMALWGEGLRGTFLPPRRI